MKFLSVCSGIEAASVAWNPLGWEAVAFSEIEPFPCAVLQHHYPNTPNWGDMTKFQEWPNVPIDLLCGGTPCQSFSVAGLRSGLDDPRGDLMLTFGAIAAKYRPRWLVWENVPGVLSSNGGRDFGTLIGMLGELGYGIAYRVLDAQYFGVAQRRRRVFVVGYRGDWRAAAAVLFERHSLSGNPAPSRTQGKGSTHNIAACLTASGRGFRMTAFGEYADDNTASTMKARDHKDATDLIAFNSRQDPVSGNVFGSLDSSRPQAQAISIQGSIISRKPENGAQGKGFDATGLSFTQTANDTHAVATPTAVRRLTPIECERLQGFPDNYTQIPWKNKPASECPDGHRYKALGNSWAVPCARWIGERINAVEEILLLQA